MGKIQTKKKTKIKILKINKFLVDICIYLNFTCLKCAKEIENFLQTVWL